MGPLFHLFPQCQHHGLLGRSVSDARLIGLDDTETAHRLDRAVGGIAGEHLLRIDGYISARRDGVGGVYVRVTCIEG